MAGLQWPCVQQMGPYVQILILWIIMTSARGASALAPTTIIAHRYRGYNPQPPSGTQHRNMRCHGAHQGLLQRAIHQAWLL